MKSFKTALLQILPEASESKNLKKGIDYCQRAKNAGADIALFPEMYNCGCTIPRNPEELKKLSVPENGEFINSFKKLAKELNMAIGITFLEVFSPLPKNTVCIFDRFGSLVLKYSKVHTCDFSDERLLTAGDDFYTAELNTKSGNLTIGAMICYDREFPESARILMLKGAEIILAPNACPMEINRISQLRARAYENMLGIATCNYPFGKPDCNGHSTAFDGIAYNDANGSRDTLIIEAVEREGIYIADFPIDELRKYRQNEVHGNAYRRQEKYGMLICESISEPFIRKDRRK